eukprot:PITA_27804
MGSLRENRSIVGDARAMLHDQGLPLHLWVEACNPTIYLQNRSPHRILGMITAKEAFLGRKPYVSHFRIFGASVYYHVSKESRKKLESKIELGVFLGYTKTPHNYRVYFPSLRMTVVRREVKFDEEKVMQCSLERELHIPLGEELLAPKEESQEVVEKPQIEDQRVETTTQVEPSREGRKRTREVEILLHDARENVGAPTSQCRKRSPNRYTRYMALMTDLIEAKPSSFEEVVEQPVWVDAMVGEYDSIVKNSVWEVVPRPADKLVVGSRWIFKVKHASDRRIEKHKAIFVAKGFSQVEEIDYEVTFATVASDEKSIRSCKEDLAREFEMKEMGLMHYFLRLEIWQGDGELFISQGKYANAILKKFCMESSKPMETPLATSLRKEDATSSEEVEATIYRQLAGSLMYLVNT